MNLADFKSIFRFFISCLGQKIQPFKVGLKLPKITKNGQNVRTSKGCNFGIKQDMKNLNTDLKSARFKYPKISTGDF